MSCGACTLCCKALEVHELSKPAGEWCVHCDKRGGGCRQYDARPQSCRTFVCAWLGSQDSARPMPAELRPDRCGVVLGVDIATGEKVAIVDPGRPDAWKSGVVGRYLAQQGGFVVRCGDKEQRGGLCAS